MRIIYNEDVMKYISLFESITNTRLRDCIIEERILFIVEEGQIGKAIGKHGSNVKRIESLIKKKIKIVEFSPSVAQFIKNLIYPSQVREIVDEGSGNIKIIGNDTASKSLIIGRDRKNLISLTNLVKRYFDVNEIKVI